jgi:hypothetical protein
MLVTLSLLLLTAQPDAPLKVYVMAGQSNMVGRRALVEELPEELKTEQADVVSFNGSEWVSLQPGVTEEEGFGPELAFAYNLQPKMDEPIGIVKFSDGGTSLAFDWDPDRPDSLYHQLLAKVRAAQASRPIEIVGMCWMQGERDSKHEEQALAYPENLKAFVERARNDFNAPDMVFAAGRVNPPEERFPHVQRVRDAQVACDARPYTFVDCDPLPKIPDDVHYTTEGLVMMGELFARAMQPLE